MIQIVENHSKIKNSSKTQKLFKNSKIISKLNSNTSHYLNTRKSFKCSNIIEILQKLKFSKLLQILEKSSRIILIL